MLYDDLEDDIARLKRQKKQLLIEFGKERDYRNELVDRVDEANSKITTLEKENQYYKKLLSNWMVSQKAFKELAIQYGNKFGIQPEEVIAQGKSLKQHVLKGENNPSHNTNADEFILFYSPKKE